MTALFTAAVVAHILPHIPGLELLRDLGLGMYAALFWWAAAWFMAYRDKCGVSNRECDGEALRPAA